jgi:DNA-binding MarR family transcriptional regulator
VHHRILFFIAVYPGLSVTQLLGHLGVSKQALNIPLRQLLEMRLVLSSTAETDKRRRQLDLSNAGSQLELALRKEQTRLLQLALQQSGETAMAGWLQFNQALGQARSE